MTRAADPTPDQPAAETRCAAAARPRADRHPRTLGRHGTDRGRPRLGVLLTFYPGWVPIALVGAMVVVAGLARAHSAAPPAVGAEVVVGLDLLGGVTAAFAGGSPVIDIGSVHLGLGGLLNFLRITVLSIVLLALGLMVSWTTNVSEFAPAVATLGKPLRWLRIPIDDWAVALSLALRAFPMLIEEFRVLYAARKLGPAPAPTSRRAKRKQWANEVVDLMAAAITVALRRGDEMGDAIAARGGTGQIAAAPSGPRRGTGRRWPSSSR